MIVYRCQKGHRHRSPRAAAACDRPPRAAGLEAYLAWLRREYRPQEASHGS